MSIEKQNRKIRFRSNTKETNLLVRIARKAITNAIRENKALGLSFVHTKNNQLVRENPDGTSEVIQNSSHKILKSSLKIKKGSILYVKS